MHFHFKVCIEGGKFGSHFLYQSLLLSTTVLNDITSEKANDAYSQKPESEGFTLMFELGWEITERKI